MKIYFKFEGAIFDIHTGVAKALHLKEQIRANRSNPVQRQYLENKLSSLYTAAIGMTYGSGNSNFKKL